jgi:hypothetical protein
MTNRWRATSIFPGLERLTDINNDDSANLSPMRVTVVMEAAQIFGAHRERILARRCLWGRPNPISFMREEVCSC